MKASTRKCQTAIERDQVYFVLTQFYPKNVMRQPPCSIILIIKGATDDHSCLNNRSWMIKIKKHHYNFFTPNRMIFQLDGFQPHHPLVNLTTHMLIYISLNDRSTQIWVREAPKFQIRNNRWMCQKAGPVMSGTVVLLESL